MSTQPSKKQGERVEQIYKLLEGAYIYAGDGGWDLITDVRKDDGVLIFETEAVSYETVPVETRDQAYDSFDGGNTIVHPDKFDTELWNKLCGEVEDNNGT